MSAEGINSGDFLRYGPENGERKLNKKRREAERDEIGEAYFIYVKFTF